MCGISGYCSNNAVSQTTLDGFRDIAQITQHRRGPDFFGAYANDDNKSVLFHNRLSLLDFSTRGNQPMTKHGLVLSFNGEIYNFRSLRSELISFGYSFQSQTDTEVILSAYDKWGKDSFSKLNGAYAFALYDISKQSMLLVRDKIGEKPLYYFFDENKRVLFFASTIQLLLQHKQVEFNHHRILSDLIFNFWSNKSETHFRGIQTLLPGFYLEFNPNLHGNLSLNTTRYWDIQPMEEDISEDKSLETLDYLVKDAVDIRVQLDARIATILSGGIDSSLLSVLGQRNLDYPLDSFTLRKYGFDDEDIVSATRISIENGWNHHPVDIRPNDISTENLRDVTLAMEEPVLDQIYLYISRNYEEVHAHGFKAVLNGQGADEIFLGYLDYYPFLRDTSFYESFASFRDYWYSQFSLKDFVRSDVVFDIIDENLRRNFIPYQSEDLLNSVLRFGVKTHLPALLIQEDKQSLNWSVECRTAYTDYRIIEFLNKIPSKLKSADGREKYLMRKLSAKYLPDYIVNRKKLGFPDLPDGRRLLISKMISDGFIENSEVIRRLFSPKLFDNVNNFSLSMQWKLCAISLFEKSFTN